MMSEGVEELVDTVQNALGSENFCDNKSFLIKFNWEQEALDVQETDSEGSLQNSAAVSNIELIDKAEYKNSKELFVKQLLDGFKKFSLLNVHVAVKIFDDESSQTVFAVKSCETFRERVQQLIGLKRHHFFEIILPDFKAELYFYVTPFGIAKPANENLLLINGYFNTAAVNTLEAKMTEKDERLKDVCFIGKVTDGDNEQLKQIFSLVVKELYLHIQDKTSVEDCPNTVELVDLTSFTDNMDVDDDIFYDINTSDIAGTDKPLESFYCEEKEGLRDGWDDRVSLNVYLDADFFDTKLLHDYIKSCEENDLIIIEENNIELPAEYQPRKSLNINFRTGAKEISALPMMAKIQQRKTIHDVSCPRISKPSFSRMAPVESISCNSSPQRSEPAKTKPKSKLFTESEAEKWQKSNSNVSMKQIISDISTEYKNIDDTLSVKIPKKAPGSPKPRPPIHTDTARKKMFDERHKNFISRAVNRIQPYNSPSFSYSNKKAPTLVASFFDARDSIMIDDDNSKSNERIRVPVKRRLLPIDSPQSDKFFFKHRRPNHDTISLDFNKKKK